MTQTRTLLSIYQTLQDRLHSPLADTEEDGLAPTASSPYRLEEDQQLNDINWKVSSSIEDVEPFPWASSPVEDVEPFPWASSSVEDVEPFPWASSSVVGTLEDVEPFPWASSPVVGTLEDVEPFQRSSVTGNMGLSF
jgi:hypothetical protein